LDQIERVKNNRENFSIFFNMLINIAVSRLEPLQSAIYIALSAAKFQIDGIPFEKSETLASGHVSSMKPIN
jgi:hypothetical protein